MSELQAKRQEKENQQQEMLLCCPCQPESWVGKAKSRGELSMPTEDRKEDVVCVAGVDDRYSRRKGCCGYSLENKNSAYQAEVSYNLVGIYKLTKQVFLEFN